jgi:eukaryotic-like serine/threonine-protein kinase
VDQPNNNVKAIFIAALDHHRGPDRAAYLDAACAGNAELKRRIEALLTAHERADEVLGRADEPVTTDPNPSRRNAEATGGELPKHEFSSSEASITSDYQEPAAPNILIAGRYQLQQKIGEGGMGEVWVAKQTEPVKRKVALKLIKTGMDSRAVLTRFEQERQALAMMDHPNIARVLDGGLTPSGQPFFVMELVNGLPLTKFCDEARLTPRERLELFVPVCQAVQHAHQKGIVHRDLKPANILVTLIDGKPVPKVIDFGVAKATAGRLTDYSMSTQFGAVVGTLEYMSPEQAGFSAVDIDTRADIYSLGVVLYELLTGLRPIDARTLKHAGLAEMIRVIKEEEPSKPSTRLSTDESLPSMAALRQTEPRRLMALLRGELDCVVMKCLEKGRERRYETANALSRDIQRYLADEPVEARPPSTGYRLSKFLRRHRGAVVAAALVLAALLAGIAGTTFGLIRAEQRRSEAMKQRDIADKASIETLAQKKIADGQKQLAVANASKADENARKAELRLAEGLISQADALSLAGRFDEAHLRYTAAHDRFIELKAPLTAPEVGLWCSYHQSTFPLLRFTGHAQAAFAVAPDGRTALFGGHSDKTLKLRDLAHGKELRSFTGHDGRVVRVAIFPDGRTALSVGEDNTRKLWDLATGKVLRSFTGDALWVGGMTSIAIAPSGRTALIGHDDGTVKLWDLTSGKQLRAFAWHSDIVWSVAFARDGGTALSGSQDDMIKLWDLTTGKELRTFTGHSGGVYCVDISPDGRKSISGGGDETLRLWDMASGKEERTLTGHTGPVTSVSIAPDGRTAVSGSRDKTLRVWELASGKALRVFLGPAGSGSFSISPDCRTAVSMSVDGTTQEFWDLSIVGEPLTLGGHAEAVVSATISPDGRTALSGSWDKTLRLWDVATGRELHVFSGHSDYVTNVAIAPDGRTAISASLDKTMKRWDLATGKELRTFTFREASYVAMVPDGRTAIAWSTGTMKLWDLDTGELLRTFPGYGVGPASFCIARDGRTALAGNQDGTLTLWDVISGRVLRSFTGNSGGVCSVAISPDGGTALSGGEETLQLWDLASGRELRTFGRHSSYVSSVAIAPDGRTAFSVSWDKTLKLWDLSNGRELRTFTGHSKWVNTLAVGPDGRVVLSGSYDNTLKLWDFNRGVVHRAFEPRVASALAGLRQAGGDPRALATLGEWYAFRGKHGWAVEFLGRARERGAAVAPLTLARSYWNLNRNADARREFQIALEQSKDPSEQIYLGWCIKAIDTESERKLQHDTIAASADRDRRRKDEAAAAVEAHMRQANHANSLVRTGVVVEGLAEVANLTKDPSWNAGDWFNFSCLYSLGSTKIPEKKNEYANRAMDLLQQAVKAGWNDAKRTASDTDLAPLRDREDFKKLLVELEKKFAAQAEKKP